MWAPCCSWSCMDSDLVEDSIQTCTSQPGPSCKACGRLLDSPARKHVCVDCKKSYCGGCSVEMEFRPRLCHTCQLFYGNLLERAELMRLKVKDLRDYLHLHEVPTQLCREKEELVELVLVQQTPSSDGFSPQIPPTRTTSFPATVIYTEAVSAEIPPTQAASPEAPPSQAASTEAQPPHAASSESPPPQAASAEAPPPQVAHAEAPPPQAAYTGTVPQDAGQSDSESETDHQTGHELQSSDTEEFLTSGRRASLSDLSNVEDVEALSVRQLKEILARNFVNYKGCCEKWELMERVRRLYQEHKELQNQDELPAGRGEDLLCKICMDAPIDCVLLECGHMVTCTKCGKRMNECPICRQYVVRAVHVFRS